MRSSSGKLRSVAGCGVTAWVVTIGSLGASFTYPDVPHWRGVLIVAGLMAVTLSLAWLIVWLMPAAADLYQAGYRAAEDAQRQRDAQQGGLRSVMSGTGTTTVVPMRRR